MDEFFPRSYDLHDPEELFDFVEDFKMVCAENILKQYIRDGRDLTDQQGGSLREQYAFIVQVGITASLLLRNTRTVSLQRRR